MSLYYYLCMRTLGKAFNAALWTFKLLYSVYRMPLYDRNLNIKWLYISYLIISFFFVLFLFMQYIFFILLCICNVIFFSLCLFREDPFSVYEANCGFYNEQEEDCCKDLNHTDFPVYTPAQKSEVRFHLGYILC